MSKKNSLVPHLIFYLIFGINPLLIVFGSFHMWDKKSRMGSRLFWVRNETLFYKTNKSGSFQKWDKNSDVGKLLRVRNGTFFYKTNKSELCLNQNSLGTHLIFFVSFWGSTLFGVVLVVFKSGTKNQVLGLGCFEFITGLFLQN